MSQVGEAFVRIRPDFSGFKESLLTDAEKKLRSLQTSVTDTENAVKRAARENISSQVAEKQSLAKLHEEYALVAKNAKRGSDIQIEANRLAAESASKLGRAYREVGTGSSIFGKHASSAASETGRLGRGALAGSGAVSHLGRSLAFASTAFLGAAGFTAGIKESISQASDLQAQMQRNDDVFGHSAGVVEKWSKSSVTSMGLTQAAALNASSTMGTLIINLGKTPAEAARMSTSFTKLAVDMAAFKKVQPEVAINALESALQGRTRSLRQFGVVIDNTTIKAEALRLGLMKGNVDMGKVADAESKVGIATEKLSLATAKHGASSIQAAAATDALHKAQATLAKATSGATGTLTAQQKALAVHAAILAQTKNEQGAFARSQGEAAIQGQKFHAALGQLEAEIGTALLPMFTKYTGELSKWLANAAQSKKLHDDLREAAKLLATAVSDVITVVKQAWGALHTFTDAVGGAKNAVILLLTALAVNKLRSITGEVIKLGLKMGLMGVESQTAAGVTERSMLGIRVASIETGAVIKGAIVTTGIGAAIIGVSLLVEYVITHWDKVKRLTMDLASAMKDTFRGMWTEIEGMAETAAGLLTTYLTAPIRALLEGLSRLPFIGGKFKSALDGLKKFTTGWVTDGVKTMKKGGEQMGGAWAGAFDTQVQSAMTYTLAQAQATLASSTNLFGGGVAGSTLNIKPGQETATASQAKIIGEAGQVANAHIPYLLGGARGGAKDLMKPTDCSGLVHNLLASAGVSSPTTSQTQWKSGQPVSGPLQPGDLIFYNNHLNEANGQPGHVTMYIGGGLMVEDPHTGADARITQVRNDGYMGARRYLNVTTATPNTSSPKSGAAAAAAAAAAPAIAIPDYTSGTVAKTKKAKGLLSNTAAINMREQLSALGDKDTGLVPAVLRRQIAEQIKLLTDAIHKGLGPETAAGLRKDIADVRHEITEGLQVGKAIASDKTKLSEYSKMIAAFPAPLRAKLMPMMAALRKEISTAQTPADIAHAKSDLESLKHAITSEQSEMRTLLRQHTREQLATWRKHLADMKAAVTQAKVPFSEAWSDMVNTAMTLFDRETSKHIDGMKANLDAAVQSIDTALQGQLDAIDAANKVLTPAEQQLKDLEDAHNAAAQRAQLARDKAQLATDTAGGADAATLVADQQAIDEDLYTTKVDALTAQAQLERDAANQRSEDAKRAAQTEHDIAAKAQQVQYDADVQNYQDLRDLQRSSLDRQLADLEKSLELRGTTVADANQKVLDTMSAFGLDPTWFTAGKTSGSNLLAGLADAYSKAGPTLQKYQDALDMEQKVTDMKPTAPTSAGDKAQAIVDELKKQTELAQQQAQRDAATYLQVNVKQGAVTDVNRVTRDALR